MVTGSSLVPKPVCRWCYRTALGCRTNAILNPFLREHRLTTNTATPPRLLSSTHLKGKLKAKQLFSENCIFPTAVSDPEGTGGFKSCTKQWLPVGCIWPDYCSSAAISCSPSLLPSPLQGPTSAELSKMAGSAYMDT